MWQSVLLLCVLFAGVKGYESTAVSRCNNNGGELPINTYVMGCINPPCLLPHLQDVVINVTFKAPRNIISMQTLMTAFMSVGPIELPIPYDLQENSITCNFLTNTNCPIRQDEVVQYTLKIFIESFFPIGTAVNLELRVVDDANVPVICVRFPSRIV